MRRVLLLLALLGACGGNRSRAREVESFIQWPDAAPHPLPPTDAAPPSVSESDAAITSDP